MGHSQALGVFQHGTVIGCHLSNKSSIVISLLLNIQQSTAICILTMWKQQLTFKYWTTSRFELAGQQVFIVMGKKNAGFFCQMHLLSPYYTQGVLWQRRSDTPDAVISTAER